MTTQPTPPRTFTQDDLRWLVCPACHHPLQLHSLQVLCTGCARRYPIVDGLPILLATQAS